MVGGPGVAWQQHEKSKIGKQTNKQTKIKISFPLRGHHGANMIPDSVLKFWGMAQQKCAWRTDALLGWETDGSRYDWLIIGTHWLRTLTKPTESFISVVSLPKVKPWPEKFSGQILDRDQLRFYVALVTLPLGQSILFCFLDLSSNNLFNIRKWYLQGNVSSQTKINKHLRR